VGAESDVDKLTRNESILLLSFFILSCFPILYICRFLDNNTLSSWRWTFAGVSVPLAMALLLGALVLAYFFSLTVPLEKHPRLALFVLSVLAVLPLWSEPELLVDSGRYFLQAKYLAQYGFPRFVREWGGEIGAWTDLPLVPALYGLLFKVFGEARVVVQTFNTLLFALTTLLISGIGHALWNKQTGFYAGLLLLGMPYLLTQVPLMLVDIPTMFFLTLALYSFIRAMQDGGAWLFLAPLAITLAIYAKYSTWPMLLVLPLTAVVIQTASRRQVMARAGGIFLAAVVMAAALAATKLPLFLEQLEILLTYQRPALGLWQEGFMSTFFFQVHPLVSLLALWGGYRAYRTGNRHFLVAVFFAVMVFGLQMKRIRYILPMLPLLALMASCGLQSFKEGQLRRFAGLAIVFSSLLIVLGGYLPFFKTTSMMNIMAAGRFLDTLPGQEVEVYVLPQNGSSGNTALTIPQLDLFTGKRLVSHQAWRQLAAGPTPSHAPLLFSWRISRPSFYAPGYMSGRKPLVVISGGGPGRWSQTELSVVGSRLPVGEFVRQSGVFRFKTIIDIYH
jgi:hypothetical protein